MDILKYITIDEALDLIQKNIKANDSYNLSAKRLLENYIEAGKIKALFKFNGFLTTYKYHDFGEVKGSIELKQISKVKGYFHEISTIYPCEFTSYVFCSNLDKVDYEIFQAVPYELLSNEFIATYYKFWKLEHDVLEKYYAKETYKETFNVELGEPATLFNSMPIIDKELSTPKNKELVQLSKREIYFETKDIESLIDSLPKSKNKIDIEQQLICAQSKIDSLESELAKANTKLADKTPYDNELNPKDSAYHLIAVLKDLLLNPDTNAYHFKTGNSKSTNQPTQAGLVEYIESIDIKGLKARNINGIFSQANRLLNDIKKR